MYSVLGRGLLLGAALLPLGAEAPKQSRTDERLALLQVPAPAPGPEADPEPDPEPGPWFHDLLLSPGEMLDYQVIDEDAPPSALPGSRFEVTCATAHVYALNEVEDGTLDLRLDRRDDHGFRLTVRLISGQEITRHEVDMDAGTTLEGAAPGVGAFLEARPRLRAEFRTLVNELSGGEESEHPTVQAWLRLLGPLFQAPAA